MAAAAVEEVEATAMLLRQLLEAQQHGNDVRVHLLLQQAAKAAAAAAANSSSSSSTSMAHPTKGNSWGYLVSLHSPLGFRV